MTHLEELRVIVKMLKCFEHKINRTELETFFSTNLIVDKRSLNNDDSIVIRYGEYWGKRFKRDSTMICISMNGFSLTKLNDIEIHRFCFTESEEQIFQRMLVNDKKTNFSAPEIFEYSELARELLTILWHLI